MISIVFKLIFLLEQDLKEILRYSTVPSAVCHSCIFSVGCSCSTNITYGFEIMVNPESSHNAFRLLMCRDLDFDRLKGKNNTDLYHLYSYF